jgi:peptide/nickel transport system ATP-binding protein
MFITHNLGVVAQMTEDVIVMYMGKVVETASVDRLFYNPKHPYTQALLRSIPRLGRKTEQQRLESIQGSVPDPYAIPLGCPFHPRCKDVMPGVCDVVTPPVINIEPGHQVRCHLYAGQGSEEGDRQLVAPQRRRDAESINLVQP